MRFSKVLLVLSATLALGACATYVDGQQQEVTLHTPGASDAKCTLDNGLRYPIRTGETLSIMRSSKDITVECFAVGNRYKKVDVPVLINEWTSLNVVNGAVPGVTYDHLAKGLYAYPDIITVDFTDMVVAGSGYELPDYHNKDVTNPYAQPIEDYGPSVARISNDSTYMKRGLEKRDPLVNSNPFATSGGVQTPSATGNSVSAAPPAAASPAKPVTGTPRGSTAEELTRSANPGVFN